MNKLTALVETIASIKSGGWDSVFLRNLPMNEDEKIVSEPYKKSGLVYVCISTTARAISQVPLRKYVRNSAGLMEQAPITDPWQRLLIRPNYLMDMYSFVESIVSLLMLDGNVWIVPFPPSVAMGGAPASMWVVSSKYIQPKRNPRTGQLDQWTYTPEKGAASVQLSPEEVCHIWFWNPYDPILGLAPLEAGRMAVISDYKAARYNQVFFDNGAQPSGVLSTEQKLSDSAWRRMSEQVTDKHTGYRKAHRLMVLEQGLQYTQTGLAAKDMEFSDLRKYTKEEVLQIFGMKKSIISVTDDLNFATAKEQRKSWWQDTNLPIMKMIESAMNFVFFGDSPKVKVMFDLTNVQALHQEMQDKVSIAKDLVGMGFTANEVNDKLEMGFQSRVWRDSWYMPVNLVPVNDETPSPELPPAPVAGDQLLLPEVLEIDIGRENKLENVWKATIRSVEQIESRYEGKVKRIFFGMRKRTLEALYKGESKSIDDVKKLNFDKEKIELSKESGKVYTNAMESAVKNLEGELGINLRFDLSDPNVISYLMSKTSKVKGVTQTIKDALNTALAQGTQEGESIEQMAERVKKVFNASTSRAKTIARTEVIGASNFGRHEALQQSGFAEFEWFTALDERVRTSHKKMHGKRRTAQQGWALAGGIIKYPGDYNGPPEEIINCRCIEVPVIASAGGTGPAPITPPEPVLPPTPELPPVPQSPKEELDSLLARYRAEATPTDTKDFLAYLDKFDREIAKIVEKAEGDLDILKGEPSKAVSDAVKWEKGNISASKLRKGLLEDITPYMGDEVKEKMAAVELRVKESPFQNRANYNKYEETPTINCINNCYDKTLQHEYGHHIEYVLKAKDKSMDFIMSRAKLDSNGYPIYEKFPTGLGYDSDEKYFKDGWWSKYMAKYYASGDTEVISMGLQQFSNEYEKNQLYAVDRKHFNFIYGILTGAL